MELDSFLLILCFFILLILCVYLYNYKINIIDSSCISYGFVVDLKEIEKINLNGYSLYLLKIVVLESLNKVNEYYYSYEGSKENFNYFIGSYLKLKLDGNKIEILGLVNSSDVGKKFKNYLKQNYAYLCES